MPQILLIDDDAALGEPLAAYFRRFELGLQQALRPSEGLARLRQGGFDAVILDVMLPEMDGFELCRTLRRESDIPIVMLTSPRELVARLQTVLRRRRPAGLAPGMAGGPATEDRLRFDGLEIDPATRGVLRQGEALELTSTEFDLLLLLARAPGKVFHRDDILNQLRGHEAELYTRAVDVLVSRLRRKLEPLDAIKTLRRGDDVLHGGDDADTFVFNFGDDRDRIVDFVDGVDTIQMNGFEGIDSFADLATKMFKNGSDVWIQLGNGDRLIIDSADVSDFDASDFQFNVV